MRLQAHLLNRFEDAPPEPLDRGREQTPLLLERRRAEPERWLDAEDVTVAGAVERRVLPDLARDGRRPDDEADILEATRAVDRRADDLARPLRPGRVVERDPPAVDHLRHPLLEILEDEVVLVRAVDEQQLDWGVEGVRRRLRQGWDRPDELCDPGALDVRLEIVEAVVRVRVDFIDGHRLAGQRAEAETDRRLPLPATDLDEHAVAAAASRELVQRLPLLVGQPAGNVGDQRLDDGRELSRTRHADATTRRSCCGRTARGRATATCPRARRDRARRSSTCGRRSRPRARKRSVP